MGAGQRCNTRSGEALCGWGMRRDRPTGLPSRPQPRPSAYELRRQVAAQFGSSLGWRRRPSRSPGTGNPRLASFITGGVERRRAYPLARVIGWVVGCSKCGCDTRPGLAWPFRTPCASSPACVERRSVESEYRVAHLAWRYGDRRKVLAARLVVAAACVHRGHCAVEAAGGSPRRFVGCWLAITSIGGPAHRSCLAKPSICAPIRSGGAMAASSPSAQPSRYALGRRTAIALGCAPAHYGAAGPTAGGRQSRWPIHCTRPRLPCGRCIGSRSPQSRRGRLLRRSCPQRSLYRDQ